MPSRYSPDTVLTECERIERVWVENPSFSLGEITLVSFQTKITDLRQKREDLEKLKMQVLSLTNEVEEGTSELSNIRTRALSGVRAVFGPNSTQYEQAGGKRQSEIRRSKRKGGDGDNNNESD